MGKNAEHHIQIKELTGQRNEWNSKAKAEVDEILARLRNAKRQIIELEEQKLKLTQKERELGEKLEEDEASYKAMVININHIHCVNFSSPVGSKEEGD